MFSSRFALALCGVVVFASSLPAQFASTLIVETGQSYSVGTFNSFPPVRPSLMSSVAAGQIVAFGGNLTTGHLGNFTAAGPSSVSAFATTQTAVPGGIGTFTVFFGTPPGASEGLVAFAGNGNPGPANAGVYSNTTGTLQPVINIATPYPGAPGTFFTNFSAPAVSGTTVIFSGSNVPAPNVPPIGVFTRTGSGTVTTIANTSTLVPGTGSSFITFTDGTSPPTGVFLPNISGTNYVIGGNGGGRMGLFTNI